MPKIKSLMNKRSIKRSEEVYNNIYNKRSWYVKNKLKARGTHDVIAKHFIKHIENKDVLDIGCGYGRFCFIVDKYAKSVTGIDRNSKSILVANDIKKVIVNCKSEFITTSIEDFRPKKKYDFILVSGTLEHIIDVKSFANKISKYLKKGGVLVSNSPSEYNIRGLIHAGLWKLFDFPMTLADVDIITPDKMKKIFLNYNIKISNNTIGTQYSRAWGKNALLDLYDRLPKVQRDLDTKKTKMNLENFFDWFSEGNIYFRNLYDIFYQKKLIKKIKPFKSRKNPINVSSFKSKYISSKDVYDYLDPNFKIDPYYSTDKNISKLSANVIYYGKKFDK